MKPKLGKKGSVIAPSADNENASVTFEPVIGQSYIIVEEGHSLPGAHYQRKIWHLMRSATTGEGGVKVCVDRGNSENEELVDFYPIAVHRYPLPSLTPQPVVAEYREAEVCYAHGAYRAASTLLRSSLEKALKANGYVSGNLKSKIDDAAADGVITESRKKKAHEDIRVLGNDVLHDDYRVVDADEVSQSLKYLQRLLEDLYEDRDTVRDILIAKGRTLVEEVLS